MEASAAVKDTTMKTIGIPPWTTSVLDSRRIGASAGRRRGATCLLLVLGSTAGCACSGVQSESSLASDKVNASPIEDVPAAPPQFPSETKADSPMNPSSVPQSMLDVARDDAATRASIDRAKITVVSAAAVTWSDGSAGCPEPGMMYTQALVPGYRIVLQAGDQVLNYHATRSGSPRYCPADRVMPPSGAGNEAI
jgi:hypothetical protein